MKVSSKIILDASVALKWILFEEDSEKACQIRTQLKEKTIEVLVPSFFYFEISNILIRKSPPAATEFLSFLKMQQLQEVGFVFGILGQAMRLMKKHPKIALYDAYYHAMALELKGTFLTADEKYYDLTKKEGHVMLLTDYK